MLEILFLMPVVRRILLFQPGLIADFLLIYFQSMTVKNGTKYKGDKYIYLYISIYILDIYIYIYYIYIYIYIYTGYLSIYIYVFIYAALYLDF